MHKTKFIENQLTYEYQIKLLRNTMKGYIASFHRSNMLINETRDQSPINEMMLIAGELQSELELELSDSGVVLRILNWGQLQEKWIRLKEKITYTYKGNIVAPFIESIDRRMLDEKLFIQALDKDLFFYYYLKGVYGEYEHNTTGFNGQLSGIYSKPLQVEKQNKLITKDKDSFCIDFTTQLTPESFAMLQTDISKDKGEGQLGIEIDGSYDFESYKCIQSIRAEHRMYWDEQLFRYTHIDIELKKNEL